MWYLKKYFTEGLIQVAILLSLCGVRVDVGLEPYLPPAWHEMILGPTSALTQTQFHNLRNRLEDGQGLHPKSVDLDGFFTARRLLGWVRSLDRLQVPNAELETWLVQREPDPLPGGRPDQASPLQRAPAGLDRDRAAPQMQPGAGNGTRDEEDEDVKEDGELTQSLQPIGRSDQSFVPTGHANQEGAQHLLRDNAALGEEEEEEEEEEELARIHWSATGRRPGGGRRGSYDCIRELTQNEADQSSLSLQECLRLLEETFPFTEEPQLCDGVLRVGNAEGNPECRPPGREALLAPVIPTGSPSLDLELHWQDLLAIMEPQDMDVDSPSMVSFPVSGDPDVAWDSRTSGTLQDSGCEVPLRRLSNCHRDDSVPVADQDLSVIEAPLQHGVLGPALLPLTPSAELENHSSAVHAGDTLENFNLNPSHSHPHHMDLLAEDPSDIFSAGLDTESNMNTFCMNSLTQDLADNINTTLTGSQYSPYAETFTSYDANIRPNVLASPSYNPSLNLNDMTHDFSASTSSLFLVDDEDKYEGEEGLPSPLGNLLHDDAILDEMSLLDLALEEGFSPEMAARLEEEGFLHREINQQETGNYDPNMAAVQEQDGDRSSSRTTVRQEQVYPRSHHEGGKDEDDSDSGLSLDFSHSPASPCASEASSYSYSSSSSSSSSSVSAAGSPFPDEEGDEEAEEVGSDMELEVTIKQEEEEEEEMGAAGGSYSTDVKKFLCGGYQDHRLFNRPPWLEHIGHDHTYNQPWSSTSSPTLGKMPTKHAKSSPRHDNTKPYHRSSAERVSEAKMWSRDERRARAMKIPFSNELIINLPVEEFNELLANHRLNDEQLTLVRDIRRRGKNKMAAQNCRKRKLDVLLGLEESVLGLRRHRLRLLQEKQEALRALKEMRRRLDGLYQEVFSSLRDEDGRPLDATEYTLQFGPNDRVIVASRRQAASLPQTNGRNSRKPRDKKK
ncbi:endoplasmic reticulum membrane sensor NFE2L1a [Myripristis murdjan]|uniref:endoplasmic reticulum membrane sensor NFE2L1a n=1 Tax=Myripristis murdjan TaxID=586833 RepID=UPI0011762DB2|nr:endoplasmic reticulum membrane sensor NFE2L1-like [Myripristis murdjan]